MITKDRIFEPVYELMAETGRAVSLSAFNSLAFFQMYDEGVSRIDPDCVEAVKQELTAAATPSEPPTVTGRSAFPDAV